jgi:hypothetical protein
LWTPITYRAETSKQHRWVSEWDTGSVQTQLTTLSLNIFLIVVTSFTALPNLM